MPLRTRNRNRCACVHTGTGYVYSSTVHVSGTWYVVRGTWYLYSTSNSDVTHVWYVVHVVNAYVVQTQRGHTYMYSTGKYKKWPQKMYLRCTVQVLLYKNYVYKKM